MYQHQITPSVKFFTVSSNITSNACCTQSVYTLYTTPLYYLKKKKMLDTLCVQQVLLITYMLIATSYPIKI
jgi:hypothetical protein